MDELRALLVAVWPELDGRGVDRVVQFYKLVLEENEIQNLTRLTSPRDFFEGHVLDVKELMSGGFLRFPCMDLGSGVGVPGLLYAAIAGGSWILAESESRKAGFLAKAAKELGLQDSVRVFSGRAEAFLSSGNFVECIVARAVGPLSRIYSWVRPCSTWNTMVLLKGPRWEDEWAEFAASKQGRELRLEQRTNYSVGAEKKSRVLVKISRVPRGT